MIKKNELLPKANYWKKGQNLYAILHVLFFLFRDNFLFSEMQ